MTTPLQTTHLNDDVHYSAQPVSGAAQTSYAEQVHNAGTVLVTVGKMLDDGKLERIGDWMIDHAPGKPSRQSLSEMLAAVTELSSKMQETTLSITDGMIEHNKKVIERNADKEIDQRDKRAEEQEKEERKQKLVKIFGWIATSLSALITVASLGSTSGLTGGLMVASTGLSSGNQIAGATKKYEEFAKDHPKFAKAMTWTVTVISVALSVGAAANAVGVSKNFSLFSTASRTASNSTTSLSDAAAEATQTEQTISDLADNAANDAVEAGQAIANAPTESEQADELMSALKKIGDRFRSEDEEVEELLEDGADAGKGAKKSDAGGDDEENEGLEKLEVMSERVRSASEFTKFGVDIAKTTYGIQLAKSEKRLTDDEADVKTITNYEHALREVESEVVKGISTQIQAIVEAWKSAADTQNKIGKRELAVAQNLTGRPSHAV